MEEMPMLNPDLSKTTNCQISVFAKTDSGHDLVVCGTRHLAGFPRLSEFDCDNMLVLGLEEGTVIKNQSAETTPIATFYTGQLTEGSLEWWPKTVEEFVQLMERDMNRAFVARKLFRSLYLTSIEYLAETDWTELRHDFVWETTAEDCVSRLYWPRFRHPHLSVREDMALAIAQPERTAFEYSQSVRKDSSRIRLCRDDPLTMLRTHFLGPNRYEIIERTRGGRVINIEWDTVNPVATIPIFMDFVMDSLGFNLDSRGFKELPEFIQLCPRYIGDTIDDIPDALIELSRRGISTKGVRTTFQSRLLDTEQPVRLQWGVTAHYNKTLDSWVGVQNTDFVNHLHHRRGPLMVLRDHGSLVVDTGTGQGVMNAFDLDSRTNWDKTREVALCQA